jgi:hypothetical protein
MMFKCPECGGALEVEEFSQEISTDPKKFFVRGVPHIEIDGYTWIEGSEFTMTQLSKQVDHIWKQKNINAEKVRSERWEKFLIADYIELQLPNDFLPEPYNRQIVRKSAIKIKDGYYDTDHLVLEQAGLRVTPVDLEIQKNLGISTIPIHKLGWQLRDQVVMKEQYVDLANIGTEDKTARQASAKYVTKA